MLIHNIGDLRRLLNSFKLDTGVIVHHDILFTLFCPFMRILSHWTPARSLLKETVQNFQKSCLLTVLETVLFLVNLAMQNSQT